MDIRERIEEELSRTMHRLRNLGGAVMLEDDAAMLAESVRWADPVDEVEHLERREMSFATRSLLLQRARQLADALDRFREGTYGVCEQCGGPIAAARVRAIPEVVTCVRCQTHLERMAKFEVGARRGFDHEHYEKSA
jgi:DnaK suppressor protein